MKTRIIGGVMVFFLFIGLTVAVDAETKFLNGLIDFSQDFELKYSFENLTKNEYVEVPIIGFCDYLVYDSCSLLMLNGSCASPVYKSVKKECVKGFEIKTLTKPLREIKNIEIAQGDKKINVTGECCEYYEKSPYKQFEGKSLISCAPIIANICNPLIQQSSSDPTVYDSEGVIYVISGKQIYTHKVGYYPYLINNDISFSELIIN